ncbi:MAG: EAL domain-containing protein [Oscillospiraceae bacterium]
MSQDLGLECIVEGVETADQVKLLKDCKCYLAQGFYFDKPLPVSEFEQRLDCMSVG